MENAQALRAAGMALAPAAGETVPTIYRADFADPSMFFLAQRFPMRHEDTIFVSNAPATDLEKFLRLLLPLAQSAGNAGSI
jgi:polysaccharide export outer membrane protein